jgi:hypothetical protein
MSCKICLTTHETFRNREEVFPRYPYRHAKPINVEEAVASGYFGCCRLSGMVMREELGQVMLVDLFAKSVCWR